MMFTTNPITGEVFYHGFNTSNKEDKPMKARIVYKNKTGWRTGKHTFLKGSEADLRAYAEKEARGREFQIQELKPENIPAHWTEDTFFEV